ncbi:MAG: UDP-3-O-acyl-N-acetylglucosamine deacetylase [Limnoraphis robusta]|uniref:UDP-3-O-acyl-N-acetylglucosamine deacetylase n=1 Tax=Limnoraphis robusta CS-951 TaxID=1637645 RepID=A0A0F5YGL5_9CYAN|nr:UDP-3-O-acyl-N-acetylglucosamine deacetylase [Limnoraphis robusta]KKD37355.1 UDP-3-O-(3-hydroxymyristoyl) glucosamine N-acyltransferase [Limnoraphis robusta CS-951]
MTETSQHTLADEIIQSGIGLHSGLETTVRILPSSAVGRYFVRVDLPEKPIIPAKITSVVSTTLSTELGILEKINPSQISIRTVEHLLSALTAMGVDHARIEIDGPEVPLLDGSAKIWAEAIANVGLAITSQITPTIAITQEIIIRQGDAFVAAIPSDETRFSYGIDFESAAIGQQWYSWTPQQEDFTTAIAPARTFVLEKQVQHLQQAGLIKGGTLDNALVCGDDRWLNPPLRFSNEPVRHKILDLVGDLSLLGVIPQAHYLAYKAGHHLHTQLVQRIQQAALVAL